MYPEHSVPSLRTDSWVLLSTMDSSTATLSLPPRTWSKSDLLNQEAAGLSRHSEVYHESWYSGSLITLLQSFKLLYGARQHHICIWVAHFVMSGLRNWHLVCLENFLACLILKASGWTLANLESISVFVKLTALSFLVCLSEVVSLLWTMRLCCFAP